MKRMTLFLSAMFFSLSIFAQQVSTAVAAKAKQAPTKIEANAKQVPNTEKANTKQAPTTILVMDSANALLHGVSITAAGCEPFTTTFDGRYVMGLPLQNDLLLTLVAPLRDTVRFTLTPTMQGQTVIIRMGERHYSEIGIGEEYDEDATSTGGKRKSRKGTVMLGYGAPMLASRASTEAAKDSYFVEEEAIETAEKADAGIPTYSVRGIANTLPSAGKLTAGEVNDFAKWALWPKLLDGSHSNYLQDWQMVPRNRYVVQLTNTQGYPIVDRSVSLTDTKGNTLFQARTDNTGKAELWDGLFETNKTTAAFVQIDGQQYPAQRFDTEGLIRISINEPCEAPEVADVFFIFDATGSMGDELRYLQAEMQDVISRSQSAVEGLHIRTGALVYRDYSDAYLTRISRLSDSIQPTQQFISAQSAAGGGDYEEAVPEAVMAAVNAAGWSPSARARIAFLILDAPCHNDETTLKLLHEQALNAAAAGIRIVPIVCSGLRESGELLMRSLALITNGSSFFLTDDSGIGGTHLKPTTDSLKVEHLNDMLVRTIISFSRMPDCQIEEWAETATEPNETDAFLPQPFEPEDLDSVPTVLPTLPLADVLSLRPNPCTEYCLVNLPLGCEALFLTDLTGKTIQGFGKMPEATLDYPIQTDMLASGIYFVKAFYGGRWYTQKLIVK